MKRNVLLIWMLLLALTACEYSQEVPKLTDYVNDYAGMLSPGEADQISRDLKLYKANSSNQIYILTIPSLEGKVLEQYSIKVAEEWKAGQKGVDNGIIILISKADRKVRIEVGYGLEDVVTDFVSSQIIREEMKPKLKEGKTAEALQGAIAKLKLTIDGKYKASATAPAPEAANDTENYELEIKWAITAFVFLLLAGIASAVYFLLGGFVGAIIAALFAAFLWHLTITGVAISGGVGFLLGMFAKDLTFFSLQLGVSFIGGGGSFGGGGASGDW